MIYTNEIIDRKTGELISVSAGDWMTIRELAELLSCGHRQTIVILREMGFLQIEGDGQNSRHRIADWVNAQGWGKRLHRKADKFPFDVVNTNAVYWVIDRWDKAKTDYHEATYTAEAITAQQVLHEYQAARGRSDMSVQMQVCWLVDHFPDLTQKMIAGVVHVTQQLVSKFLKIRSADITKAQQLKANTFLC